MSGHDFDSLKQRLADGSAEYFSRLDEVACLLWENGEMLGDWEGGTSPTWTIIKDERSQPLVDGTPESEFRRACYDYYARCTADAQKLLAFPADDALRIASIMIERASACFAQSQAMLYRSLDVSRNEVNLLRRLAEKRTARDD